MTAPRWGNGLRYLSRLAQRLSVPTVIEPKNQIFHWLIDRGDALLLENMSFDSCSFTNCHISLPERSRRSVVRNVSLRDCAANACGVGPAMLEDLEIDGLSTGDLLIIWGATFKHVTLRGDIGKINPWVHFVDRTPAVRQPFDEYKAKLYRSIDCALDISRARNAASERRPDGRSLTAARPPGSPVP